MDKLKTFLSTSGLTQSQFAQKIGVSQAMVYQILNGIRPVSEKVCVRIEGVSERAVTRQDLRPNDWHEIWPELINLRKPELSEHI
ncbi:MAG: transcriptional regulator [Paenalcaligenes sp.]